MDPTSHESLPSVPHQERISPRIDEVELVKPPSEKAEQSLPSEILAKASDAVNQAVSITPTTQDDTAATDDQAISPATYQGNPAIADDVDVIEKEWVQKAKQIVSKTKEDPYAQSIEMNVFKHDYMKKRYGKEIKLPEEIKRPKG